MGVVGRGAGWCLVGLEFVDDGLAFGLDAGFEGLAFELGVAFETLQAHARAELAAAAHGATDIFVLGGRFSSGLGGFGEILDLLVLGLRLGLGVWRVGGATNGEYGEEKGFKCVFKRHAGLLRDRRLTDKKMSVKALRKLWVGLALEPSSFNLGRMKNTSKIKFLGMALALFASAGAEAQLFKITKGTQPGALTESQWDQLISELQTTVNANFPTVETGQYTKGMANAAAMASTGTASTYGASFKYGLVGGSVAVGVDLGEGNKLTEIDAKKVAGFAIQSAVVLGFTPGAVTSGQWGPIDPARLRMYLSFLALDQTQDGADISFTSMGLVGQYRLIEERSLGLSVLKWNGVDVSSGFRIAKNKFSYTQTLSAIPTTVNGVTATVAAAPATIGADVNVFSVPVEVSTSVRLLYILNFFGGMGGDFNFGSSKAIADYSTTISVPGGTATGALDLGGDTSPTPWNLRAFGGLGLEFAIGQINLGVGKSLTAGTWATNLSLNLFY